MGPGRAGRANGSGRKKGTKNKDAAPIEAKAKELGIDPFTVLLLFAAGDWKALGYDAEKQIVRSKDYMNEVYTIKPETRQKSAADCCQYLYSKRRSVTVAQQVSIQSTGCENLSDTELEDDLSDEDD